jgi:NAD(P)-dependent dehydrogenase (short-subunit alcohol dehydrogenase family)
VSGRRFEGRTAVITGAGGVIGTATARRLAGEGARIFVVDRDEDAVAAGLRAAADAGGEADGLVADVSRAEDVAGYAEAAARFGGGGVEMFFNNAGIEGPIGPITEIDPDRFDEVIAVNVRGVFLGLREMLPRLRDGGAIVNTGSTASLFGTPNVSPYHASKHAVLGLTRSVAKEAVERGIRVNCVCPGPVESRMMTAIEEGLSAEAGEMLGSFEATIPFGRYARPDEIAAAVSFLFSDDAGYITGAALPVEGGQQA